MIIGGQSFLLRHNYRIKCRRESVKEKPWSASPDWGGNGDPITAVAPGAPAGAIGKSVPNVIIYTVGLGNSTDLPPNAGLLKRIANDPSSPDFDKTKPAGLYGPSATSGDLDAAFRQVASLIEKRSQ